MADNVRRTLARWVGLTPKCEVRISYQIRSNPLQWAEVQDADNGLSQKHTKFRVTVSWQEHKSAREQSTKSVSYTNSCLIGDTASTLPPPPSPSPITGPGDQFDRDVFVLEDPQCLRSETWEMNHLVWHGVTLRFPVKINHDQICPAPTALSPARSDGRRSECSIRGVQSPSCPPTARTCHSAG